MNDNLYGSKILNEHECGSFERNSSVTPFYLFIYLFSLFLYFLYFCGLIGSFYLSLICPLGDLLIYPIWGSFPYLRATLYISQEYKEDLHTLQEALNIKRNENYHDVCKCMPVPV